MKYYRSKICGTGEFFPKKTMTNRDLEKIIETSDEWIFERSGIRERRISSREGGEFPSDMAYYASQMALKNAGLVANDIEMIFFATVTPDYKLPNSASILQTKLGITNNCAAFDLAAACSGHLYALTMANCMIQTGQIRNALLVSSEMLSTEIDWSSRGTSILFGDGCGAFILGVNTDPDDPAEVVASILGADGTGMDFFHQKIGGAIHPLNKDNVEKPERYMQMNGKEMFKVAVRTLVQNAQAVLKKASMTIDDIDWVVPHQANARILEATADRLNLPREKMILNIEHFANTSAATIPTAFHQAVVAGKIQRGQTILMDAFGAGLTSGACIIRY